MKTVLSGIRSTGHLHLGNYFGALRNFAQLQHQAKCFFFIADLHSLTTHPKAEDFHSNVKIILSEYLASDLILKNRHFSFKAAFPRYANCMYSSIC
jgi:tryptophanyl-tRNA synthetase